MYPADKTSSNLLIIDSVLFYSIQVALTDYGSHSGSHINRPSETEDTSSELSNTGTELNIAQADSTSDVIEFVANPSSASIDIDSVTEEQVTSSQPSPSKVEETRCPDKELPVNSSKLQCKQMVLWQKGKLEVHT